MGHKTGVYRANFMINFTRGVTIGVIGITSLTISGQSGVPQNNLIAARGLGLIIAPMVFGSVIGRLLLTGEVFRCVSGALVVKAACELYLAAQGSSPLLLCLALLSMGIAMGILDTAGGVVITTVHGQKCALPLNVIHAMYGTGGMLAPLFALAAGERAWHVLALVDLAVAMAVTRTRLNRRLPLAGPQHGTPPEPAAGPPAALEVAAPARVFGAGAGFLVLAQAAETAVSAWGFTFAVSHFGLAPEVAALFPTVFYFAFTATRFFLVPASAGIAPSAMVQAGTLVAFCGALVLLSACSLAGVGAEEASPALVRWLLFSVAVLGAGTCPMYAMVLASVRQHGKLDARQVGLYGMCGNFGNTLGMWVPGVVSLPLAELAWTTCMVVLMASRAEDFPWRRPPAAKLLG